MSASRQQPARLVGWKEIATFLGKSVRTVQRWERELGLPIRRIRTSDSGQSVYAECQQLEDWLARQSSDILSEDTRDPNAPMIVESGPTAESTPAERPNPDDEQSGIAPADPPVTFRGRASRLALAGTITAAFVAVVAAAAWTSKGWIGAQPHSDADLMYATTQDSVDLIDAATGVVLQQFPIPESAPYSTFRERGTRSADGRLLAIPTQGQTGVAIFDVTRQQFVGWYAISLPRITRAEFNRDGTRLAALDQNGPIHFVDTASGTLVGTASVAGESWDMIRDAAGSGIWIPSRETGMLTHIDFATMTVQGTIRIPRGSHQIVASADRAAAVVTSLWEKSVSCVALNEGTVRATATTAQMPRKLAMGPDGRYAYVASHESAWIAVVDARTCEVIHAVPDDPGSGQIESLSVNPSGSRLYVMRTLPTSMDVLDITKHPPALFVSRRLPGLARIIPSPIASSGRD